MKVKEKLSLADLRDGFNVTDVAWVVYRRRDGSLGLIDVSTEQGEVCLANVVKGGGVVVGRASGVSGKEALAAARRKLAAS